MMTIDKTFVGMRKFSVRRFANMFFQWVLFSKKFAHYLTINDVTLSISRKGEEAITIGKEAKPTLSKLLTRSDDVQIKSTMEAAKLTDDVLMEE